VDRGPASGRRSPGRVRGRAAARGMS
jgi:hypothetical protein